MFKPKVLMVMLLLTASAVPIYSAKADTLIWSSWVSSNGTPVTSITLESLHNYRIEAREVFCYDSSHNYAADAMYYTDDTPDWNWVSHHALPDGHSFLQINGGDVNWGPFSNGDTYHTYTITRIGEGDPIVFSIKDWMDSNYDNNYCHLVVKIYDEGEILTPGYTPGFWKHNIGVALDYNNGAYSAFRDGTKLTEAMLLGYAATVGVTLQEAYVALTANGPGMDTVRADMANAFNAAAGYGPF